MTATLIDINWRHFLITEVAGLTCPTEHTCEQIIQCRYHHNLSRLRRSSANMGTNWKQLDMDLQSKDEDVVLKALLELKKTKKEMDQDATNTIIPKCLEKLQHHDIHTRSAAMGVLTTQIRISNTSIVSHLDTVCKKLASPNLLDLQAGKDQREVHSALHTDICYVIGMLQNSFPRKLMTSFKPLCHYIIECTAHSSRDVARAGVDFWAKMTVPPVPPQQMNQWVAPVHSKLNKLINALLDAMIYQEEHVAQLEKQGEGASKSPEDIEQITDLRNYAALSFEHMCGIFPQEIMTIFKPIVERRVMGSNWLETEASLLALSAFTSALGTPKEMNDLYPKLLNKLLELYSHPRPLVRSITCFTMQHFINIKPRGVKDFFSKVMKKTTALISDSNAEVQVMSLRCMAAILAYTDHDCSAYSDKLIEGFSKFTPIDKDAKLVYFECLGHFFGRMGTTIERDDMRNAITPLMDYWKSGTLDPEVTVVACQALCTIAMYTKSNFSPYTDTIFDKSTKYLDRVINGSTDAQGDCGEKHSLAYMDLLSAILEGQGSSLQRTVKKYELVPKLVSLLQKKKLKTSVVQSALALVGNVSNSCFSSVEPHMDIIVTIIANKVSSKQTTTEVRINALWCLTFFSEKASEPNDGLLKLTDTLINIIKSQQYDQGSVINAALTITNQAMLYPKILNAAVTNDEVFMHLCQLLQTEFPRDTERDRLFKNMVCIAQENLKKLKVACWAQYCRAAAVVTSQDDALNSMLRSNLRDVRGSLGQNGWKKLTLQIGPQLGFALRKRYKLY